jgi:23S rRNA pseudouridine2604 synthase
MDRLCVQIRDRCAQVNLQVVPIRRLRIGKVSLARMSVSEWRYLPVSEKF